MKKKYLFLSVLTGIMLSGVTAHAIDRADYNPIDTSLEDSREAGSDLYEAAKFHNVVPLAFASSEGQDTSLLLDENYGTSVTFTAGTRLTVASETVMDSAFIVWDTLNVPWILEINGNQYTYGQFGFLHEFIQLPEKTNSFDIIIPDSASGGARPGTVPGGARISDIYAFDENTPIPSWVQLWQPTTTAADIVVVSTHADDEQIFFGGILPTYQPERNVRVQVIYVANHWTYSSDSKVREHEKLTGLWVSGIRHYPVTGDFGDAFSASLEEAMTQTNINDVTMWLAQLFRITHPQVIVTHDVNGEYGHGQHRLTSAAVCAAVEGAANPEYDPAGAESIGVWNTPKLYVHLAADNQIKMNYRVPLESYAGKRAIDVARQAYKCHDSQQYCWFTVDDYGSLANNVYGLIRTTVGADTTADMMENLTSYTVMEEIKRQEEESKAEESRKESEAESVSRSIEESEEESRKESESIKQSIEESEKATETEAPIEDTEETEETSVINTGDITPTTAADSNANTKKKNFIPILIIIVIAAGALATGIVIYIHKKNERKRRRLRRKKGKRPTKR